MSQDTYGNIILEFLPEQEVFLALAVGAQDFTQGSDFREYVEVPNAVNGKDWPETLLEFMGFENIGITRHEGSEGRKTYDAQFAGRWSDENVSVIGFLASTGMRVHSSFSSEDDDSWNITSAEGETETHTDWNQRVPSKVLKKHEQLTAGVLHLEELLTGTPDGTVFTASEMLALLTEARGKIPSK